MERLAARLSQVLKSYPNPNTMDTVMHEDKVFDNINYAAKQLVNREFLNCSFTNCDFTKSDISNNDFVDCRFNNCNFSMAIMHQTGLKNSQFTNCKLMGVDFSVTSTFLFSVSFKDCVLDYASFLRKKMKKASFINCSLKEADFSEADLSMAVFNNCDLLNTIFMRTILEKTDFCTARNFAFDPELNKVKKARFSQGDLAGLLYKFNLDIDFG